MTVGELVKTKRCERGLTMEQLGILLGYKAGASIAMIEYGQYGIPEDKRSKFMEVLGMTEEETRVGNSEEYVKPHRAKMRNGKYVSDIEWHKNYEKNHYECYKVRFKAGDRDKFIEESKKKGYDSFNQFIIDAIVEKLKRKR